MAVSMVGGCLGVAPAVFAAAAHDVQLAVQWSGLGGTRGKVGGGAPCGMAAKLVWTRTPAE